jgi:hypothetical protein
MKGKNIIIPVIAAAVFGTGGFFGGLEYQKSKVPSMANGFPRAVGSRATGFPEVNGTPSAGRGGGMTLGEIISKDDKSITVKSDSGSTKTIYFTDSTKITKSGSGSKDDLTTGAKVMTNGTSNSDGSVSAINIQIQP